ncbi:methylated-DNA--[protein]-cysteine S-methyltransferase (plasmid) [Nicoliella spurrieriana]|uniref:methylated-DNA--[protein]-cysteine S-methyltransferase n=1 Tax=Nicoliella spurrieriana TaxID=2925830 RepID=A0A976X511_9LACO|nr:methylated-DNA--[protein]-cysteine S-methyltransferase [Nicoliella spurrieriana]UQS86131.1 methylated-DNA--[protein]-cysteine S-methyltransferase [Nicoliella spurrieriana]
MNYQYVYETQIGPVTMLSDDRYLLGLWLKNQRYFGADYNLDAALTKLTVPIEAAINWLDDYFAGNHPDVKMVPLNPVTTSFRKQVFNELLMVPYGQTITYAAIAEAIQNDASKSKNLARAVGGAVGHNPIALIIPCHRVIGSDGQMTGYAGGIPNKRFLLNFEQST